MKKVTNNQECLEALRKAKKGEIIFFDEDDFISKSKVYREVIKHRRTCNNLLKGNFCLECFGFGLTRFGEKLLREYQEHIKERLNKHEKEG